MTFRTFFLLILLGTSTFSLVGKEVTSLYHPDSSLYLITGKSVTIDRVKDSLFKPLSFYPDILDRAPDRAIWVRFDCRVNERTELVLDFIRKDYVSLYLMREDSVISAYQTGFLLPSRDKKMGRWNAIDILIDPGINYTVVCKIVNQVNDPDLAILINHRKVWRDKLLYGIIMDIAFLSMILIVSFYSILIYFQNRIGAFLHFSMYLLTVFIFYLYILDILRDFFVQNNPHLTLYLPCVILLAPYFYLGFMQNFLNTKELIPNGNRLISIVSRANLVAFIFVLCYYPLARDYYPVRDIIRFTLLGDLLVGIYLMVLIWRKRDQLVLYFVVGSTVMLVAALADVIIWTTGESLGEIARIGFLLEVCLFSLGLGKKNQIMEQEKALAQESYISQLKINEKLIEDQRDKLEAKVNERTAELIEAKEEAEKSARIKEEFLSVMSHEIRTPMNAIVGLTHMLSFKDQQPDFEENLTTLRYSVDNLMLLINNVLDYNKIDAGKVELETVDFDLANTVNSVSHLFKSKADSKKLGFQVSIDEKLPDVINGDPFRLSQVLNNFLSNAIKFTEKGRIDLSVVMQKEASDSACIKFIIKDTGIGISADKLEGVFQSFTQAGKDTARKYGGSGLGLSIARGLIQMMDGHIEIESQVNQGSTFAFDAWFKKADDARLKVSSKNYSLNKNTELDHLKVLIVDDNELNRVVLKKFLDKWNVQNEGAENGIVCLKKIKEKKYDLILLDLQMPEMDGYEVAKVMRSDPSMAQIPIIAISADTISNVYDSVIASGMNDFITKPFNPDELKSKMYTHTLKSKS